MINESLENEFIRNLSLLDKEQQEQVLAYIKSLIQKPKISESDILLFAGTMDSNDAREISHAIEAGCESIDNNEW